MIGVFALQGAFAEHEAMLSRLGAEYREIRRREHFTADLGGVILPGGESTVQGKLLKEEGLFAPLKEAIEGGLPVFGTCAGLILLAKRLSGDETVWLGTMDVTVKRNAYGRQLGSFAETLPVEGIGQFPAVFIRAPYVEACAPPAVPLAVQGGKVVAVRQQNMLATAFHPELTSDMRLHAYFLNMVQHYERSQL